MNYQLKKVLLIVLLFILGILVFLSVGSSVSRADDEQSGSILSTISSAYREALISPLQRATGEISDPEIASFSTKLVQTYGLNQETTNSSEDELADLLPDLKNIHRTAMDLPLMEAGKQLKDKELSDFYNSFIQQIGVKQ